jgi:hypothetical protein
MERKTHFDSEDDVEAYFAALIELWDKPKPQPPRYCWERIQQARLLSVRQPVKAYHPIARPDFSRLQFPKIGKQKSTCKVKTIHKIAEVPRIRASPQKNSKLKKVSSVRDLLSTRWHET